MLEDRGGKSIFSAVCLVRSRYSALGSGSKLQVHHNALNTSYCRFYVRAFFPRLALGAAAR
jgi:hypothetical protein